MLKENLLAKIDEISNFIDQWKEEVEENYDDMTEGEILDFYEKAKEVLEMLYN